MEKHVMKITNFSSEFIDIESEVFVNKEIKMEEEEEEIGISSLRLRTLDVSAADFTTASMGHPIKMDIFIDPRKLIEAVHLRPAIWDMTNINYLDRDKRRQSWEEIVAIFAEKTGAKDDMKTIGDVLQKKWKNIRDRYAREMHVAKKKSGCTSKKRTRYMYAQQMAFLKDTIKHRQSTTALSENPSGTIVSDRVEINSPSDRPSLKDIRQKDDSSNLKQFEKKKRLSPVESMTIKALDESILQPESKDRSVDDDDLHFLLSLHPSMKSIPGHLKLSARMEMMQCVNKFLNYTISVPSLHQVTPLNVNRPSHPQTCPLSTPVSSPNDSVTSYLSNYSAEDDLQTDANHFT